MSSDKKAQVLKPLTAANKLGIYLPAAPEHFRNAPISRGELDELRDNPPEWLTELWRSGPFPRDVVARKLGVSNSGLARSGVSDALTADEVSVLNADPPEWLLRERESYAAVQRENARVAAQKEERRSVSDSSAEHGSR